MRIFPIYKTRALVLWSAHAAGAPSGNVGRVATGGHIGLERSGNWIRWVNRPMAGCGGAEVSIAQR